MGIKKRPVRNGVVVLVVAALATVLLAPATASARGGGKGSAPSHSTEPVVLEFESGSEFTSGEPTLGWSRLTRKDDGLRAIVHVNGLRPGGVFTFWWTVLQGDRDFPGDFFVARGDSRVIGRNGRATLSMTADIGDPSIAGLPYLDECCPGQSFTSLNDPRGALVRIEIAYHGQVEDAGTELGVWQSDFWTGAACPAPGETNPEGQPYCPVYIASEHSP